MPHRDPERPTSPLETEPPVADTSGRHSAESPDKPPPPPRDRGREGGTSRAGARNVPPRQQETGDFSSGPSGALDPEGQAGRIVRPEPVTEEAQRARKSVRKPVSKTSPATGGAKAPQEKTPQENQGPSSPGDDRFSGTID